MTVIHKDIESLEFKVSSEKSVFNTMSLDKCIDTLHEESSPIHKYLTNFAVDVYAVDGMGEILTDIGFLKGTSIQAEATFTDVSGLLELCDMFSTDLYLMAVDITGKDGRVKKSVCPHYGNIMYIENMFVEEKYRGLGIGRYLLDNVGDLFLRALNYSHNTYILKPYPQVWVGKHSLQDDESATNDEKARLVNFYKRAGYKFIRGSDYMSKIIRDEFFEMLGI